LAQKTVIACKINGKAIDVSRKCRNQLTTVLLPKRKKRFLKNQKSFTGKFKTRRPEIFSCNMHTSRKRLLVLLSSYHELDDTFIQKRVKNFQHAIVPINVKLLAINQRVKIIRCPSGFQTAP
jgi:hypothetical protein